MKIYTRGGDTGETSLIGGGRVEKSDPRIESYGTVDELNSFVGLARAGGLPEDLDTQLELVQNDLFDIGAQLAANEGEARFPGAKGERITELEQAIDRFEGELEPLKNFILPGGSEGAARLHVARSVCRRAERLIVALQRNDLTTTVAYVNRLSDFLFVAARVANRRSGVEDVVWRRR